MENSFIYLESMSDSAKAEYILESKDFDSVDSFLKSLEDKIIEHTVDKKDGCFMVNDFYNCNKAPWNIRLPDYIFVDSVHYLNSIFLSLKEIIWSNVKELFSDKSFGLKEMNLVKVTDDFVLEDKCLLYFEFVIDHNYIFANSIYNVNSKGIKICSDILNKRLDAEIYCDPTIMFNVKMLGVEKFNK